MRKQHGFEGQRSIIIPDYIVQDIKKAPISSQLFITDIGYYPDARFHQRTRENGCKQYILIYCVKGEGWFSLQGKKMKVSTNQFFIIPKETPHSYASDEQNPWSIYWVHFDGKLASSFYDSEKISQTILPSKISRIEERLQLFEEIIQNLEMGYSRENLEYANICLLHFLASFKYINQFRQLKKFRENDTVENTILFMKENLDKRLPLEDLANNSKLSVSHFSMVFRKKTSKAPMDYLIHLRIQRACQLLDHTELKIKDIALKVGIEDQYYFSRIFKKIMGTAPVAYRNLPKG